MFADVHAQDILIAPEIRGRAIGTPSHPFYVVSRGWVEAKSLAAGDGLVMQPGEVALVESVGQEALDEPVAMYNNEVEGWHTYYVGDSAVLVHNACRN